MRRCGRRRLGEHLRRRARRRGRCAGRQNRASIGVDHGRPPLLLAEAGVGRPVGIQVLDRPGARADAAVEGVADDEDAPVLGLDGHPVDEVVARTQIEREPAQKQMHVVFEGETDAAEQLFRRRQADAELRKSVEMKYSVSNLYDLPMDTRLQGELQKQLDEVMNRPTSQYDSHPAPHERIAWIERMHLPLSPVLDNRTPALLLLPNPDALQREMTAELMKSVIIEG